MTQPSRVWSEHIHDMLLRPAEHIHDMLLRPDVIVQRDTLYALHALCRVLENIQGTLEKVDARLARMEIGEGLK